MTSPAAPAVRGPRIEFDKVSLALGGNRILKDVSFSVEPGTVHCLIGPNGAGKTSLVRCLLGQMPHTGRIAMRWPGERRVGYVPQTLDFDHTLPVTVEDFMAMIGQRRPAFLGLAPRLRRQVRHALERVGMYERRHRTFGQLSGGERQRVLLAQALLPAPGLLVLDEPLTGMDRQGGEVFRSLLGGLRDEGVTVVWIHHDLREVRDMADAVTCVNRTLQFCGAPDDMLTPERILGVYSTTPEEASA